MADVAVSGLALYRLPAGECVLRIRGGIALTADDLPIDNATTRRKRGCDFEGRHDAGRRRRPATERDNAAIGADVDRSSGNPLITVQGFSNLKAQLFVASHQPIPPLKNVLCHSIPPVACSRIADPDFRAGKAGRESGKLGLRHR